MYDATRFTETAIQKDAVSTLAVPEGCILWVDVVGLSDPGVVTALGNRFGFHPLALEDALNVPQRPKVEAYDNHLLVVLRAARYPDEADQVSLFLAPGVVVSIHERPSQLFGPVAARLAKEGGRLRAAGADRLLHALCDAVIDGFFPALETLGDDLESLEERTVAAPDAGLRREILSLKRRIRGMRRAVWPAREAMNELVRDETPLVDPGTRVFFRDCYDHVVQLMEMVDSYRDAANDLVDEHLMSVSNRMNEIMKVLTIVSTVFIPLSFVASLYGMNFDVSASPFNMPELRWRFGYPLVLLLMALVAGGMVWSFRKRKWF